MILGGLVHCWLLKQRFNCSFYTGEILSSDEPIPDLSLAIQDKSDRNQVK